MATDLNLDGNADLIFSSGLVLFGDGHGGFSAGPSLTTAPLTSLIAGDFNNDGIPDILALQNDSLLCFLSNGDSTFQPVKTTALLTGLAPTFLASADVNSDGAADVIIIGIFNRYLIGDGAGSFTDQTLCTEGDNPRSAIYSDWNNDGIIDIALFGEYSATYLGPVNQPSSVTDFCPVGGPEIYPIPKVPNGAPLALGAPLSGLHATDFVYSLPSDPHVYVTLAVLAVHVTLNAGSGAGLYEHPIALTATVDTPGAAGTIAFYDGAVVIGYAQVVNGVATLSVTSLPPGPQELYAHYVPGGLYGPGASAITSRSNVPLPSGGLRSSALVPTGAYPYAMVAADFNRDGITDLATANINDSTVTILTGSRTGAYPSTPVYSGPNPISVVAADFNGDGFPDLAVANAGDNSISILLNGSGSTFRLNQNLPGPTDIQVVIAMDYDVDGITDLVAVGFEGVLQVFRGNGDGTFSPFASGGLSDFSYSIAASDLDEDGRPDFVAGVLDDLTGSYLEAFFNRYDAPSTGICASGSGQYAFGIALADFNGDGFPDIATANYGDPYEGVRGSISVVLSPGKISGSCAAPLVSTYFSNSSFFAIAAGDINGDGSNDIAAISYDGLSVYTGNGDGTFQAPVLYATTSAEAVAIGDFNGDGVVDVAAVNGLENNIQIFLGIPVACVYSLNTASIAFDKNGGTFNLAVKSTGAGCGWTATASDSFIQLSQTSGAGNGSISVTLPPNNGTTALTGTIQIAGLSVPVTLWSTAQAFADVPPSDYYFDAVNELKAKGITSGCTADDYCPTQNIPRSQMAVFLVRAVYGGDNFTYNPMPYFTDVPADSFGFAWIQKLYELGITTGCGPSLFCPTDQVARDQMAAFIIRMRYGASLSVPYPSTPYFTDVPPSEFAFSYVQRMKEDAITSGCTTTTYCPSNPVTRGDMAIFMMRGAFNQLLPPTEPVITSISPASLALGSTSTFTILGVNTAFQQGITQLVFPPTSGITVNSITVTSPTTMQVSLTVSPTAPQQPVSIYEQTEPQEAVLPNGLVIQ